MPDHGHRNDAVIWTEIALLLAGVAFIAACLYGAWCLWETLGVWR